MAHHITLGMSHTVMLKEQNALELSHRADHMVGFYAVNGCYVQPTQETFQLLMNMLLAILVRSDNEIQIHYLQRFQYDINYLKYL